MAFYVHEFEVSGIGTFPLDMLRYDGCYPASSEDAARIANALDRDIDPKTRKGVKIKLTRCTNSAKWMPTHGRWESFLWWVVDGSERRIR